MKRFLILFVLFVIMINTAYADEFKLIYSSVPDGASCVPADSDFVFEYSHRIDPFDIEIVLNGGEHPVTYNIKDGKKLTVIPQKPLKYGTIYNLSVNGVKDIYEGRQAQAQQFVFSTENAIKIISETASEQTGEYIGKVKNISDSSAEIVCIVTAKTDSGDKMYDFKLLKRIIPANDETKFRHIFRGISSPYRICAYIFSDFSKLTPADKTDNNCN